MSTNLYTMSLDDLRNLANTQPEETPASAEQPRDEQGRFVAVETQPTEAETEIQTEVTPENQTEEESYLHREEIDNGEGGKEVFEGVGATPEEALQDCMAKILEAKAHATRKIRELTRPAAPAPTVNLQDENQLAQEFLTSPSQAFDKIYQQKFGETPQQTKDRLAKLSDIELAQNRANSAATFQQSNPEYFDCPENTAKMEKWMHINGRSKDWTAETLQAAYDDIKDLLKTKPAPAPASVTRARTSGISTRGTGTAPAPQKVDTSKMSLEQLRELAGGYVYPS